MFLAIILCLAMFLVSLVWGMFLKKNMVGNEISRLEEAVDTVQENILIGGVPSDADLVLKTTALLNKRGIYCFSLATEDGQSVIEGGSACFPDDLLLEVQRDIKKKQNTTIAYHGSSWALFTFSHRQVVIGKPLVNGDRLFSGTLTVSSSLEPLYTKIRQESKVVLFYVLINTIIFTGIGLLRMMQFVMKPIERLIALSKKYASSNSIFFQDDNNNEFANLSTSLNNLFSRIRDDNEKLRKTVVLLESANLELERNKKEMVRTEKLAAIGRLSAGLAHEIGNPLSIILGYVDLLGREDLTTLERQQFSKNSQLELDRIKTLIRQLLDFARPVNMPEQSIAVNDLVHQVIGFVGVEKAFAHCTIVQQLHAVKDVLTVHADSLRQVVLNCLLNAADSLDAVDHVGEIVISTANSEEDTTSASLSISIKDNGTGIADDHLENVFDPFFTTKAPGQGTGLGLFVCHTIIERLGGSIAIRNNPCGEKGSEVVITLPLSESRQILSC